MRAWLKETLVDRDTAATGAPGLRAFRVHIGLAEPQEPVRGTSVDRWMTGTTTMQLASNLLAVTTVRVDQRLLDDPTYVGKKFGGMAGYTEQAYLRGTTEHLEITFGRDFLWWGPGRFGQLLLSAPSSPSSRPLDQVRLKGTVGPITGVAFAAQLDPLEANRRYLSGHRLVWRVSDRLYAAASELILYGGPNRPAEWNLLNPLPIYYGETSNDEMHWGVDNNSFLGIELRGRPTKESELYGELLVDDFQIVKKEPGDLEPNELGFMVGGQWADPGGLDGMTLGAEYAQVRNRTYGQCNAWNWYLHRNQPMGYRGNDLDDLTVDVRGWANGTLRWRVAWHQSRQGEGRITDPWTAPWMVYTVEQGYHEPFPTGVVERKRSLSGEAEWQPVRGVFVAGRIGQEWARNVGNVLGLSERRTLWQLTATFWLEHVLSPSLQ